MSYSQATRVARVIGNGKDLDAATVWFRAVVSSAFRDPQEAETAFRSVPGLVGLVMFKEALARADRMPDA